MKRRDFCKALALSAAALAVPRAAAENTQGAVGRAVADGRYSMRFRSELSLTDVPHDYYYSDSFFAHSALEYRADTTHAQGGDSQQYLSDFYIGMRGAWNTATAENLAGGEELWQALTAGAVSTLREG